MKSMGAGKTGIAATVVVLCCTIAQHGLVDAQSAAGHTATDAQEVHAFFLAGVAAFNAHDLDEFLEQFADDINMYTPTGWLRGSAQVRERFATTFTRFPSVRMEIDNLMARPVGPDMVVTDFLWRVYPGGSGPAYHGVGSGVYVRRDGQWREVLEHETVTLVDEALRPPPQP